LRGIGILWVQPQRQLRPLEAHHCKLRLLVMSPERAQEIRDQQRGPIVIGPNFGGALVVLDRLFKVAADKRMAGVEIVAFVGIRIELERTLELGDRVLVPAN
jgi:hypothetical protein